MAARPLTPSAVGLRPVDVRFWVYWVLATIVGAAIYLALLIPVNIVLMGLRPIEPGAAGPPLIVMGLASLITSGLMGALLGAGQWIVLRRYLAHSGGWIAATAVGYALPLMTGPAGMAGQLFLDLASLGPLLLFLEFALLLGCLQWLVLRGRLRRSGWWVPISLAGWALAVLLTIVLNVTGLYIEPMDMLFAFLVPVIVGGAGMQWLLSDTIRAQRIVTVSPDV